MFSSKHIVNIVSARINGIIGALFVLKYAEIYAGFPALAATGYLLVYSALIYLLNKPSVRTKLTAGSKTQYAYLIIAAVLLGLFIYLVPRIGAIGRLPAIVEWIELYNAGIFPYYSGLTPSSFPALFFISMPFYYIGNLGWLEVIGLALFIFYTIKHSKTGPEFWVRNILLFSTPVMLYSFAVRDELFFNVILLMGLIYLAVKYVNPEKRDLTFFLLALLFGIGLSTRSVAAMLVLIFMLWFFRQNLLSFFVFGLTAAMVFIAILIPFILWDPIGFLIRGPFAIQAHLSGLPSWLTLLFFAAAVYAGWAAADLKEVFFSSGVILFLMIILSYVIKIWEFGFYVAFFEDKIDLSYLAFCIPLLLMSISEYKVGRFLGRVYED